MTPYRKLAIIEAKPGLFSFKVFVSREQCALYRLEILRDGEKRIWRIYKYPFVSLGLNQPAHLIKDNASKNDLLKVLPKGWTVPEFFTAAVFYRFGKELK